MIMLAPHSGEAPVSSLVEVGRKSASPGYIEYAMKMLGLAIRWMRSEPGPF
jgi:hypothetical protein